MSHQPISPAARAALDAGLKSAIEDIRVDLPLKAWDLDAPCIPRRDQRPWALTLLFAVMSPIVALAYELSR